MQSGVRIGRETRASNRRKNKQGKKLAQIDEIYETNESMLEWERRGARM